VCKATAQWPRWLVARLLCWLFGASPLAYVLALISLLRPPNMAATTGRARQAQGDENLRLRRAPVQDAISERPPTIVRGVYPVQACACLPTCVLIFGADA